MKSITLKSPSKINLYLKILRRRRDGFHSMLTLFHRISLVDQLTLKKRPRGDFSLRCSNPKVPTGEKNLITRAHRLLQKEYPKLPGVSVRLQKRIPMEAGLGGGSGNAAAFLLGMKKLYGLRISNKKLSKMGRKLGADIPFFLSETNQAIGRARGDEIEKRPLKGRLWFLLVLSNKGLSTKEVFSKLPRKLRPPSLTKANRTVKLFCNFLRAKDLQQITHVLLNDLEVPAFQLRPSLSTIKDKFEKEGVLTSLMSGSGATIFAIFTNQKNARACARKMKKKLPGKKLVVCHTY